MIPHSLLRMNDIVRLGEEYHEYGFKFSEYCHEDAVSLLLMQHDKIRMFKQIIECCKDANTPDVRCNSNPFNPHEWYNNANYVYNALSYIPQLNDVMIIPDASTRNIKIIFFDLNHDVMCMSVSDNGKISNVHYLSFISYQLYKMWHDLGFLFGPFELPSIDFYPTFNQSFYPDEHGNETVIGPQILEIFKRLVYELELGYSWNQVLSYKFPNGITLQETIYEIGGILPKLIDMYLKLI
jgi:hypothetical protein